MIELLNFLKLIFVVVTKSKNILYDEIDNNTINPI